MARCHCTTKPPPPHARLHREHNAVATHGTHKDVGEISNYTHARSITATRHASHEKKRRERREPRKYVTMSSHAAHTSEATCSRPAPPTETNEGVEPTRVQGEE